MKFLTPWNHNDFAPLSDFRKEMNQLFSKFFEDFAPMEGRGLGDEFSPKINVKEMEKEFQISAELPGMEEKDIEVSLTDNALTIKGEKKFESEDKREGYHRVECSYGSFQRVIPIPVEIDSEKVTAKYEKGILNIHLPKSEVIESKAKRIEIKS